MKKSTLFIFAVCIAVFHTNAQAPTINSFSPASGPVGTLVTVLGTNLNTPTAFTIGGVAAIVVSDNGTSLVGMVMPGATSGGISVTTAGGTALGASNYIVTPTLHPASQMGNKLVGTGAAGVAQQGVSVAISADGNTAILGGNSDSSSVGAAWIFIRSGNNWVQQGSKLVGTGAVGTAQQGSAVALSADGNTALVSGVTDNSNAGAVWVFTRNGSTWSQQGPKLVGSGAIGGSQLGSALALSADGNIALIGGAFDNGDTGAVWVFSRSGTVWTQQGPKLVGTGSVDFPQQGYSVALSADGSVALSGGPGDNGDLGAVWVFTRSGITWAQQGPKLVGSGAATGGSGEGNAVAISADGNTAIVGGSHDDTSTGAIWVFTRTGTTWTQQGPKLLGTGIVYTPATGVFFGASVATSADGNTLIASGSVDNNFIGATWVYTRSGGTWTQQGAKLVGTGYAGGSWQGGGLGLSSSGNTALVGGGLDNGDIGAAWVFGPSCIPDSSFTHDTIPVTALPYGWNGLTFTGPDTKTAQMTNSAGCDSVATLMLVVDSALGIPEINSTSPIHLYPNPNRGSFTLQTVNSIGSSYTISDMLGSVIAQQTITSDSQVIDLPEAGEGVYTLVVKGSPPVRFVIVH